MRLTKKQAVPLLVFAVLFLLAAAVMLALAIMLRNELFVLLTIACAVLCALFFFLREAFTKGPHERYKDAAQKEEARRNGRQFEEEKGDDGQ